MKKRIDYFFGLSLDDYSLDEFNSLYTEIKKYTRIIGGVQDLDLILRGIKKTMNKKVKKINVLMRVIVDGDSASTFHSKCDYKGPTLTLVITDKNRKFGGFTSVGWDQSSSYKIDTKAFIFSFDNSEIYFPKNVNSQSAIYCHSSYGPTFGNGHDFYISNQCKSNTSSYDNTPYHYNTQGKKNVLSIEYNFKVLDYEVYQLIFS